MKIEDVKKTAYAMPLTNPAFPRGPYRFTDREYVIITYRTDPERLRAVVPEPLEMSEPLVHYEFIRMRDSTGFGDYTETGQVIPVTFKGQAGGYVHSMFLDDGAPISGGREIWGFPKKLGFPKVVHEGDVIVGTLHYGSQLCAAGSIGYKHQIMDAAARAKLLQSIASPNFLLKIMPHVDGTTRLCELVRYTLQDIELHGAWTSPAALELYQHVIADVARLPVLEVVPPNITSPTSLWEWGKWSSTICQPTLGQIAKHENPLDRTICQIWSRGADVARGGRFRLLPSGRLQGPRRSRVPSVLDLRRFHWLHQRGFDCGQPAREKAGALGGILVAGDQSAVGYLRTRRESGRPFGGHCEWALDHDAGATWLFPAPFNQSLDVNAGL